MERKFHRVIVHMAQEDVAMLFRKYGLVSSPVVDEKEKPVGMITVDDVVDVLDEEAEEEEEEDLMRLGGVVENHLHGSLVSNKRLHFCWLAISSITAITTKRVIGAFGTTIGKNVGFGSINDTCSLDERDCRHSIFNRNTPCFI